jgi:hypothetical protein
LLLGSLFWAQLLNAFWLGSGGGGFVHISAAPISGAHLLLCARLLLRTRLRLGASLKAQLLSALFGVHVRLLVSHAVAKTGLLVSDAVVQTGLLVLDAPSPLAMISAARS